MAGGRDGVELRLPPNSGHSDHRISSRKPAGRAASIVEVAFVLGLGLVVSAINAATAYLLRSKLRRWREPAGVAAISVPVPLVLMIGAVGWIGSLPNSPPPNDAAGMLAVGLMMLLGIAVLFSVISAFAAVRWLRSTRP